MVIIYKSLYLEAKYWVFFITGQKKSKAEVIVILVVVQRS